MKSKDIEFLKSFNDEEKQAVLDYLSLGIRNKVKVLDFIEFKKQVIEMKNKGEE